MITLKSQKAEIEVAGKPKMTDLAACMRKLIIILNVIITPNPPWNTKIAALHT